MAAYDYDLFTIGAGSGGVRASRVASALGARVAIAEEYRVGGTCVIRGCVPKKLLVYASRFAHDFEDARGYGWSFSEPRFDWRTLIGKIDRELARLETAYTANLENAHVTIAKSRAVIEEANTVLLTASGERVRARHILIATGGTPHVGFAIPGIEHTISSNEAFLMPHLPRRILVQGGGYIAVEFACIFAGLGSQVTLIYRGGNILRGFDDDVRAHVHDEMMARGIDIRSSCTVTHIGKRDDEYVATLSGGNVVAVDKILFAIGRRPNVADLGLEGVGVRLADNGGIAVDAFSQTTVPSIHAVGDVTNRVNLTPVAIREGHAFADTVFGGRPTRVDHADVPTAVFSEPEVGVIGLTETQARERFARVLIYRSAFRPMRVTISGRASRALLKLVVDGESDRVVGCHIVGPDAGELIQIVGIPVKMGATKADFDATMAVHPTAAEELVTMHRPTAVYERAAAE